VPCAGLTTSVVGVPKTIDGDLKYGDVLISFGFDTACKVEIGDCSAAVQSFRAMRFRSTVAATPRGVLRPRSADVLKDSCVCIPQLLAEMTGNIFIDAASARE